MNDTLSIDRLDGPEYSTVCLLCVHFNYIGSAGRTCAAFPEGIPPDIWRGDDHHVRPREGDHGLQFVPRDGVVD